MLQRNKDEDDRFLIRDDASKKKVIEGNKRKICLPRIL